MADHPNVQRVRDGYAAFAAGDLDKVKDFFDSDVEWHVTHAGDLSGDYKGQDEVLGFFARLLQETGGSLKQEIHDVLANDMHGIALVQQSAERNGKQLTQNAVHIMHISDEGKVTEFWNFPEDSRGVEEFWS